MDELRTVDAQWLMQQPFKEPEWIIEDLMPTGLHLLTGAPKVGKSWLVLDLALKVSSGEPLWGFATRKCGVLYLALEDVYTRIQQRLWRLTDVAGNNLNFAVASERIATGLIAQMQEFIERHDGIGLVIIDTLQMVRTPSRDSAYAADYNDIGALKRFADENELAMVLIHHTRKLGDSDVFNTVSGTTGITGSADSTFVLTKQNRCDGNATLSITGRDIEFQELKLRFNNCRWELVEKTSKEELEEREIPDTVLRVLDFMATRVGGWSGTATELLEEIGMDDVSVAVLGKHLAQHRLFLASRGISYDRKHVREGNILTLEKSIGDGSEGCEG